MKTSIFAILLMLSASNSFAANQWTFQIPVDRTYPIQLFNNIPRPNSITMIQLFRDYLSGQVYEARLFRTCIDPILERYAQPAPEVQALDSLDALGWIRFWNFVHQESPLTLEAVQMLNVLYRVELIIHNLRSEQELDESASIT